MNAKPRGLNFWMVLALCVGNMVGSGIYLLPATLAPLGTNQLLGWMVTIAGATALAAAFARMGARLPGSGGPYAYAQAAFGPFAGFATAWSYWVMLWAGNGAIAVAVVSNLSLVVPWIGKTPGVPAIISFVNMSSSVFTGASVRITVDKASTLKKNSISKLPFSVLAMTLPPAKYKSANSKFVQAKTEATTKKKRGHERARLV